MRTLIPPTELDALVFVHASTRVDQSPPVPESVYRTFSPRIDQMQGFSTWIATLADGITHVGLTWRWSELRRGIVAVTDVSSISCNLVIAATDGNGDEVASAMQTMLYLNRTVHRLEWQPYATNVLSELNRTNDLP